MINLKNVSYRYKGSSSYVLHNISVCFRPGQLNVIIGKNGAGKTTLFDILARLLPAEGTLMGIPSEREIMYQLQGLIFPTTLTGKDLFRFFLYTDPLNTIKVSKIPYQDEFMSPNEVEFMKHIWNAKYGNLSIGERRYLSILAITLLERKLYIFDEPTSGVDPEARIRVLNRIQHLTQDPNKIVIMSTHTLHELKNYDCSIHLLNSGKFEFQGSYFSFLDYYKSNDPDQAFYNMIHSSQQ